MQDELLHAVECLHPCGKTQQLSEKEPQKGVGVFGFVRTRNAANADNVLLPKAKCRWQVVVDENEWSRSNRLLFVWCKSIHSESKSNVSTV
jgi:hypothetical protein